MSKHSGSPRKGRGRGRVANMSSQVGGSKSRQSKGQHQKGPNKHTDDVNNNDMSLDYDLFSQEFNLRKPSSRSGKKDNRKEKKRKYSGHNEGISPEGKQLCVGVAIAENEESVSDNDSDYELVINSKNEKKSSGATSINPREAVSPDDILFDSPSSAQHVPSCDISTRTRSKTRETGESETCSDGTGKDNAPVGSAILAKVFDKVFDGEDLTNKDEEIQENVGDDDVDDNEAEEVESTTGSLTEFENDGGLAKMMRTVIQQENKKSEKRMMKFERKMMKEMRAESTNIYKKFVASMTEVYDELEKEISDKVEKKLSEKYDNEIKGYREKLESLEEEMKNRPAPKVTEEVIKIVRDDILSGMEKSQSVATFLDKVCKQRIDNKIKSGELDNGAEKMKQLHSQIVDMKGQMSSMSYDIDLLNPDPYAQEHLCIVCTGVPYTPGENPRKVAIAILSDMKALLESEGKSFECEKLGVIAAKRIGSLNSIYPLFKIVLGAPDQKIAVLREKWVLANSELYSNVRMRTSKSNATRAMEDNIRLVKDCLPELDEYRLAGNSRLVLKGSRDSRSSFEDRRRGRARGRGRGVRSARGNQRPRGGGHRYPDGMDHESADSSEVRDYRDSSSRARGRSDAGRNGRSRGQVRGRGSSRGRNPRGGRSGPPVSSDWRDEFWDNFDEEFPEMNVE